MLTGEGIFFFFSVLFSTFYSPFLGYNSEITFLDLLDILGCFMDLRDSAESSTLSSLLRLLLQGDGRVFCDGTTNPNAVAACALQVEVHPILLDTPSPHSRLHERATHDRIFIKWLSVCVYEE